MSAPRAAWTRRSVLVLGLSTFAGTLAADPAPAEDTTVVLGRVAFAAPPGVRAAPEVPGITRPWPWQGTALAPDGSAPAVIVLARADLDSTDAEEVLGSLLAGSGSGALPGLVIEPRRNRTLGGTRGDQARLDFSYQLSRTLRCHGTLLIATRSAPPAAVLVVLGDDSLTAGTVENCLDSLRWLS